MNGCQLWVQVSETIASSHKLVGPATRISTRGQIFFTASIGQFWNSVFHGIF